MKKLQTILLIAFMMSAFWPRVSMAKSKLNSLERLVNSNLTPTEVYFDLDELETNKFLRLYYKAGDLLKGTKYPLNLKAEVYVFREDADRKILAIFNKTVKSDKSSKNIIFKSELDLIRDGDRLLVDLYDSDNKFYGTYYHDQVNLSVATLSDAEINTELQSISSSSVDCAFDGTNPECILEFVVNHLNFVPSFDKRLITEVKRNELGGYDVLLPLRKRARLRKKVGKFDVNGGGSGTGSGGDNFFSNVEQGYYPFFNTVKDTVGAIQYVEGEGITFNVQNEGDAAFTVLDTGVIKLAETELGPTPENGVLEFDGDDIYYTQNNTRTLLSYDTSDFVDLSNGGVNYEPITFVRNGRLQDPIFNGKLTFLDGNTPGYILTQGPNGMGMWQDPASLLANGTFSNITIDNSTITNSSILNSYFANGTVNNTNIVNSNFINGNITNSNIDNSSFTNGVILHSSFVNGNISNSNIDNSNFTNGVVSNTTINNSTMNNGFLQDPTINGTALFTNNSTVVIEGGLFINGGNTGWVLTSDATGNATWQPIPSSADNLGNHIAGQNLNLNGFSLINAQDINGVTANFENLNVNGSLFYANGANLGFVLTTDAAGNASWIDPATLTANGDNLGNHTATQALAMAGFSVTNADQVNGVTANFTDANLTGATFFANTSSIQVNGTLMIQPGASAGRVLTSDAAGNATWQPIPSSADNLGSHIAGQNLNLNGFSLINAQDINGVTANFENLNINGSIFYANGASLGFVLTTDAAGNASWVDPTTLTANGDNLGNHTATQALAMAGFSITNSDQVNGATANFTTANHTTVNTTNKNVTGFAFFSGTSNVQFNGGIAITTGASAGRILTSDASGNATWQPAPSGADHMGNHIARQALDMNGFTLFNADQVNGATANFTTGNFTNSNITGFGLFAAGSNAQFNGGVAITTGAALGRVLSSDAAGNATWVDPATLASNGDNLGNHTATQALAMAGFSVTNADQVNGVTANFTTVNATTGAITTVNSTNVNTTNLDATGFALFDTGSTIQMNGTITIPAGAAAGRVLTSDASGNATWQPAGAGADHMGNHIARQALDMNGFTLFNADQVNGTTANFTNSNITGFGLFAAGSNAQFNGGVAITTGAALGRVLTSDAAGNATWVDPATLGSNGDNLGNHAATQALAMAGFSVTNADQVNGVTANFANINATGSTFFANASDIQINGSLMIQPGAINGHVLATDALGNASWQNLSTLIANNPHINAGEFTENGPFGFLYPSDYSGAQTVIIGEQNIVNADIVLGKNGDAIFNEQGLDSDFRIESDGDGNMFIVDASTNRIGVGAGSAPEALLEVGNGTVVQMVDAENGMLVGGELEVRYAVYSDSLDTNRIDLANFALYRAASTVRFNGTINIPAAAAAGRVLTSDASGNATWQPAGSGADHMGNHIARQALDMNGFTLFNADQVNGATANFTTVNATTGAITTVNSTNVNTTNLDATGFGLFDTGSIIQMNGTITIPAGAAAGRVLTSDASGNATWQPAGSGADHMGNHIARQALDMNGFTLFNADQVNGASANFNNLTLTSGYGFFNGGTTAQFNGTINIPTGAAANLVLTSDASGNATWQAVSNADTLDGLDADDFLRSNTSDNYTSGTLTLDAATELNAAAASTVDIDGQLEIADANITLNAANTIFTQTTGDIEFAPATNDDLNVDLSGAGDFTIEDTNFIVNNNGHVGIDDVDLNYELEVNGTTLSNVILNKFLINNTSGVAVTVDWNDSNRQVITMAHNVTFTFTAPTHGGVGAFTLILRQDATGSRLATWPAAVLWPSGVAPTLTTTANAVDVVSCLYDGTNYLCQLGADFR